VDKKELFRKTLITAYSASEKKMPFTTLKTVVERESASELEKLLQEAIKPSPKKVEGYFVCPLCGNHKKLSKMSGPGWAERWIKMKRNSYLAVLEGETEPAFRVKEKQEHLTKYIEPETVSEEYAIQVAKHAIELLPLEDRSQDLQEALVKLSLDFLLRQNEAGEPIIRQPIITPISNAEAKKLISFRINFGNRQFGRQQKYFLIMAELRRGGATIVAQMLKELKEKLGPGEESETLTKAILKIAPQVAVEETTTQEEELEKIIKGQKVSKEFEVEAPFEIESAIQKEIKEKKPPEDEFEFPEFGYGEISIEDARQIEELINKIVIERGLLILDKLFPKFQALKDRDLSGFKEVDELSIAEVKEIIKLVKGTPLSRLEKLMQSIMRLWGIKEEFYKEEMQKFLVFVGFLEWQINVIRDNCLKIYKALK